jgi:hypothetical protein
LISSSFFLRSSSIWASFYCLNFSSHSLYRRRPPFCLGFQLALLPPFPSDIPGIELVGRTII